MRRLLILSFLFCLLSLTQTVNAASNSITKTELDLKLELQKKDIDANKEQTAETKAFIKEELDNQKEYNIDSRRYISDKADIINWWLAAIGIVVTLIGVFSAWRVVVTEKDVKDKIKEIDKTAEENKKKMQKDLEAVSEMKKEIEKIKLEVDGCLTKIKGNTDKSIELVNRASENFNKQPLDFKNQKEIQEDKGITEYVDDISKSKTESELTANDWLLKGYDAYQNKDFDGACYYYNKALLLNDKNSTVYDFWAATLFNKAKESNNSSMCIEAIAKYKKSLELDPNNISNYNLIGNIFVYLGIKTGEPENFNNAIDNYKKAIDKEYSNATVYNNWGIALYALAKIKQDPQLFFDSILKYDKAIEIDRMDSMFLTNLSVALINYFNLTGNLNQNQQRIKETLLKAESLKEGSGSYHFACLYSLLNEKEKALEWLEKNLNNKEYRQSRETIEKNKDFDSIKEDPRFKKLLNRYYPQ